LYSTKVELYKMLQSQTTELDHVKSFSSPGKKITMECIKCSESKKITALLDLTLKEKDKLEREVKILSREKTKLEEKIARKKNPSLAEKEITRLQAVNDSLIEALSEKATAIFSMEEQNKKSGVVLTPSKPSGDDDGDNQT